MACLFTIRRTGVELGNILADMKLLGGSVLFLGLLSLCSAHPHPAVTSEDNVPAEEMDGEYIYNHIDTSSIYDTQCLHVQMLHCAEYIT